VRTKCAQLAAAVVIFLVLSSSLALAGCGGGSSSSGEGDAPLTIASGGFPTEQLILGEIYAQALEGAGYTVKRALGNEAESAAKHDLLSGKVSGYPISAGRLLISFFGLDPAKVPTSERRAYAMARSDAESHGLRALPPTPYASSYVVGAKKGTAGRLGLKDLSDLKPKSQRLTFSGAPECPELIECLIGLRRYYGLKFKSFDPAYVTARYDVLEKGEADLSMLYTTDAQLAGDSRYVVLRDDKHALPAGGQTVFVTTPEVVKEAGPGFERVVREAQQGLTLAVMRKLNAEAELRKVSPEAVAARYLESEGLGA
jgi:osmoprotectant transport system substrate-binding protein